MIAQKRIDEIARDAVVKAVRDLAHERMGLSERLEAYWAQDVSEAEMEADMDRLEAAIRLHLHEGAGLAALLVAIEAADTDYERRYPLVLRALSLAAQLGYPAGIGFDPKEGMDRPVVYIELPGVGQVSWHMPAHSETFDDHTTAEKYERCAEYAALLAAGAFDDE